MDNPDNTYREKVYDFLYRMPVGHILFIHSSGDGLLGGFHLLAIVKSAAMHMGVLFRFF